MEYYPNTHSNQILEYQVAQPVMWELIVQVIVPTQVLAFTVSWMGVQYTLEIVQFTHAKTMTHYSS